MTFDGVRRWMRLERVFVIKPTELDEDEIARFEEHATRLMVTNAPRVLLVVAVFLLLWWPSDILFFGGQPETSRRLQQWRLSVVAFLCLTVAVSHVTGLMRRRPFLVAGSALVLGFSITAWFMGRMGAGEEPWFDFFVGVPMFTVLLVVPVRTRLFINVSMFVCTYAAFFLARPSALHDSWQVAVASNYLFAILFATLVGNLAYTALRASFAANLRLETSQNHLLELTEKLEQTVDERTQQLRTALRTAEDVRTRERLWVVREMHDALGQELTALQYGLETLRTRVGTAAARSAFEPVMELLNRASGTTRRILSGLVDGDAPLGSLRESLQNLAGQVRARSELEVELSIEPLDTGPLPEAVIMAVYRIGQEASTNVIRHAGATRLTMTVRQDQEFLELEVVDDGCGLSPDYRAGIGMTGIARRAEDLRGRAVWRPAEGGGTCLRVRMAWAL